MKYLKSIFVFLLLVIFVQADQLNVKEAEFWSKINLYDSKTDSYYFPFELWTGAYWDGVKESKLHKADLILMAKNTSRDQ